jgi:hypothetical protein
VRIYLAARYGRHPEMQQVAADLQAAGHEVTSRWIWGSHDLPSGVDVPDRAEATRFAVEDIADLMKAECLISFTEAPGADGRARGGRHVEYGIALALHMTHTGAMRLITVGPRENVFHWLPFVAVYPTFDDALAAIGQAVPV